MFILMLKWVKTPLLPWNHRGSWFDSQPYDWTDIGTGAPVVRTETGRQEPDEEAVPGRWKWHELLVVYFLFDDAADAFHNREEGNDYLLWVFTHGICNCIVFRTVKIIYIYIIARCPSPDLEPGGAGNRQECVHTMGWLAKEEQHTYWCLARKGFAKQDRLQWCQELQPERSCPVQLGSPSVSSLYLLKTSTSKQLVSSPLQAIWSYLVHVRY